MCFSTYPYVRNMKSLQFAQNEWGKHANQVVKCRDCFRLSVLNLEMSKLPPMSCVAIMFVGSVFQIGGCLT